MKTRRKTRQGILLASFVLCVLAAGVFAASVFFTHPEKTGLYCDQDRREIGKAIADTRLFERVEPLDPHPSAHENDLRIRACLRNEYGMWVRQDFADKHEKLVKGCRFDEIRGYYTNGLANIRQNDKWGYANYQTGEIVIPPVYDNSGGFSWYGSWQKKNGLWGVISGTGKINIPFQYDFWSISRKGWILGKAGKRGMISDDFRIIIPFVYKHIIDANDAVIAACTDEKHCGISDWHGRVIVPFQYQAVGLDEMGNEQKQVQNRVLLYQDSDHKTYYYDLDTARKTLKGNGDLTQIIAPTPY